MKIRRPFPRIGAVSLVFEVALGAVGARAQLVDISGLTTNPDGGDPTDAAAVTSCNGAPQTGVVFRNSEVEPHLAVNPTDPDNMIAGWHQDRWSTGGAQSLGAAYTFDGGATWARVTLPFTRCSGGAGTAGGDFERASDPWISFSPDGTAHYMALVFKNSVNENGMVVASSSDGGATWSDPVVIKKSPAQDTNGTSLFHDKNTLTADPHDPNVVYATWTVFRWGNTSILFARSNDGGLTWSPARPVGGVRTLDPANLVSFRQGAQIVALPDGRLRNFFYRILFDRATAQVTLEQASFHSDNGGLTWTKLDATVSPFKQRFAIDPELGIPVRDAGPLPDVAVNPSSGALYVVWQDDNGSGGAGVKISASFDGGSTWSTPVPANPNVGDTTNVQAFLPSVAVNSDGQVGVLFFDFRHDVLGDAPLSTDVWVSIFDPNLALVREQRVTGDSMDLRQSVIVGGRGYFPGDYMGFESNGQDFVAAFTRTKDLGLPVNFPQPASGVYVDANDRTNITFGRVAP